MPYITLTDSKLGMIAGEPWSLQIRLITEDGTIPADTAIVEANFLDSRYTSEHAATRAIGVGGYSLNWVPTLVVNGQVGGWTGTIPAADTAQLLADPGDKLSEIMMRSVFLFITVDGVTLKQDVEIEVLRGA